MRYDNVEQQIPCRILNRRLLKFVFSIDLLDFFHRLLNRSDGLHSPGRGDQLLPAAGAKPLGGDLLRGFDIIRHSAVSRESSVVSTVLVSSVLVSTVGWSIPLASLLSGNTVSQSTTDGCSSTGKDGIAQHCGLES